METLELDGIARKGPDGSDYRQAQKLIGGFRCVITMSEANQWHERVTGTALWDRFCGNHAEIEGLECAIKGGDSSFLADYMDARRLREGMLREYYELGKAWFDGEVVPARDARRQAEKDGAPPAPENVRGS